MWVAREESRLGPQVSCRILGPVYVGLVLGLGGIPCQLLVVVFGCLDSSRDRGLVNLVGFVIVEVRGDSPWILTRP